MENGINISVMLVEPKAELRLDAGEAQNLIVIRDTILFWA